MTRGNQEQQLFKNMTCLLLPSRDVGLVSSYTVAQFKPFKLTINEEAVKNELYRQYDGQEEGAVIVSDLTYVLFA